MLSYWEQESFVDADHIIVGSGIVGLSTAIAIKQQDVDRSVLILERGVLPTGASTKNAGFACIGSLTELLHDLNTLSEQQVINLLLQRRQGLALLRERIGDQNLEYISAGSYELLMEKDLRALERLDDINLMLADHFDTRVFSVCDNKIEEFGFCDSRVKAIVSNSCEGQIHTGKMMKSLLSIASSLGVQIYTGAMVTGWHEGSKGITVRVKQGHLDNDIEFRAQHLSICTNAFSRTLLPNLDLSPGRGQVIVTEPIESLKFRGVFHYDEGYYYFRNHGKRVIFGGARNLDFQGESSTEMKLNPKIIQHLREELKSLILPDTAFEIAHHWTGIMAFGKNKVPLLARPSQRLSYGIRLGGMGVAIGSILGKQLAELAML